MYFVSNLPSGPLSFAKFLIASATQIVSLATPPEVLAAAELMHQYRDTPMDFADATLVLLADQTGTTDILTLDRRGVSTYRRATRRPYMLGRALFFVFTLNQM